MATLPRSVLDALTRHAIDLTRYSNGAVHRIIAVLNRADSDMLAKIAVALDRLPAGGGTLEHIERVLKSVRELNAEAYRTLREGIQDEMRALAASEAKWQDRLYNNLLPVAADYAGVSAQQAYAAAYSRPFQGRLLREWAHDIGEQRMVRIRDAIRIGYLEGRTTSQIVSDLRGTRARGYSDGIIEIDRRHAESVVRTALSHTAATARNEFFRENDDILGDEVWVATLAGRTSPICRVRSGKRYDKHHKPVEHSLPYLGGPGRAHWNCRSTGVRLLKGQTELYGTQASQAGYVDANMSYGEWLKTQPASVQDDILGSTRGALFRQGGLKLDSFVNDKGKTLTISQLEERFPAAAQKAGLTLPYQPPPGQPRDAIAKFLASPTDQRELLERMYASQSMHFADELRVVQNVKRVEGYSASDESLAAVRYYTGNGYTAINKSMRTSGGSLEERQFSALAVSSFPGIGEFKGEIWRAPTASRVRGDAWWGRASVGEHLDIGHQLQSFSSRAEVSSDHFGGDSALLLRIKQPKGGAYVEPLTLNPDEHEVLLPPGLKYRVTGKGATTLRGRNWRVIDLEIDDE